MKDLGVVEVQEEEVAGNIRRLVVILVVVGIGKFFFVRLFD